VNSPVLRSRNRAGFQELWDVRRVWHAQPHWAQMQVVVLRNLCGVGVGLFAAEGF
jgi:hypothetical protein